MLEESIRSDDIKGHKDTDGAAKIATIVLRHSADGGSISLRRPCSARRKNITPFEL
jgi:hypothetical protein